MSKERVFDFLLGENVDYVLKNFSGKIMLEEKGILQSNEEGNLILLTETGEILIRLNKAKNIDTVELGNYIGITYAASTVELRKSFSKEDVLETFYETLENLGSEINLCMRVGTTPLVQYMGTLMPTIIEEDTIEIECDKFRCTIVLDDIETISNYYEEDELVYEFKMKQGIEIIIGFMD